MAELSDDILGVLDRVIVRSPFGELLGATLQSAAEDRVVVHLPFRETLATLGDTVHGGAISGLVDIAATTAFWASPTIAPGSRGTTIGFSINFVSGARGTDLLAEATVRRRGREICTGDVAVRDAEGREVALALVTYKLSPPG